MATTSRKSKQTRTPVSPSDLDDADLRRELEHMYETRADTFFGGSPQALETHTERMLALETEFARRRPTDVTPDPERTRAGARARAGDDPDEGASRGGKGTKGAPSKGDAAKPARTSAKTTYTAKSAGAAKGSSAAKRSNAAKGASASAKASGGGSRRSAKEPKSGGTRSPGGASNDAKNKGVAGRAKDALRPGGKSEARQRAAREKIAPPAKSMAKGRGAPKRVPSA